MRLDRFIREFDHFLRITATALGELPVSRLYSDADRAQSAEKWTKNDPTTAHFANKQEQKHSSGLMRINHAGEVAAQALYRAQHLFAQDLGVKRHLLKAAEEELVHLEWTTERLYQLDSQPSKLTPFWYLGSFAIGSIAAQFGDKYSLGFVQETEKQVEAHLSDHLKQLPMADAISRAILERMQFDEAQHANQANQAGAVALPQCAKRVMQGCAEVMRKLAYWI